MSQSHKGHSVFSVLFFFSWPKQSASSTTILYLYKFTSAQLNMKTLSSRSKKQYNTAYPVILQHKTLHSGGCCHQGKSYQSPHNIISVVSLSQN